MRCYDESPDASDALEIGAKTGLGIDTVLEVIVHHLPAPQGDLNAPLKALLVDSWYDVHLGVVVLIRIVDDRVKKAQTIRMMRRSGSTKFELRNAEYGQIPPFELRRPGRAPFD